MKAGTPCYWYKNHHRAFRSKFFLQHFDAHFYNRRKNGIIELKQVVMVGLSQDGSYL